MLMNNNKNKKKFFYICFIFITPIILQNVIEALIYSIHIFYSMPKFGEEALSAYNIINIPYTIIYLITIGISISGNIFFTKFYHQKKFKKCQENFIFQICVLLFFIIIMNLIFFVFPTKIIEFFKNLSKEKLDDPIKFNDYAQIYLKKAGFIFSFTVASIIFYNVCFIIKKTKISLTISTFILITTIIIIYLFFTIKSQEEFDFETFCNILLISRGVELSLIIIYLLWNKPFFSPFQKAKIKFTDFKNFFSIFWIILLNEIQFALFLITQPILLFNKGGYIVLNAFNINAAVMYFFYSLFPACSTIVYKFIGKEIGKKNYKSAKNKAKQIIFIFLFLGIIFTVLAFISSFIMETLTKNITQKDNSLKETVNLAKWYIKWQSIAVSFQVLTVTIYSIVRLVGYRKTVFFLDTIYTWIIVILGIFLFYNKMNWLNSDSVIIYISLAEIIATTFALAIYFKIKWNQ